MRVIFPRSASGTWGDFQGANLGAPTSSHFPWECIYLPFGTTHVVCPWAWPSHGSSLSQGPPSGGMSTSRVRLLPTGTRTMALKPPFSSLCYCSVLRLILATPHLGDASSWAMPRLGDALSWRCLILAMPQAVSLLTSFLGLLEWSHYM